MARRSAARGRRSRVGGRLQSQEDVRIRRPDRQTSGQRKVHGGRQRYDAVAPRLLERRRRRPADAGNRADREWNPEGISQRQTVLETYGPRRYRQWTPREL